MVPVLTEMEENARLYSGIFIAQLHSDVDSDVKWIKDI